MSPIDQSTDNVPQGPGGALGVAITDLLERLRSPSADVTVVSDEAVTWPDGSLGCPEVGLNYTQALVPGRRIVLSVGEFEYHYHAGRSGDPFLCPPERVVAPSDGANPDI